MSFFRLCKTICLFVCTITSVLSNASDNPVQAVEAAKPPKKSLDAEMLDIASKGALHFRTREAPLANVSVVLLSFLPDDGGAAILRILNGRGDDIFFGTERISAADFVKKLATASSSFKFDSKNGAYTAKVGSVLERKRTDSLASNISFKIEFSPVSRIGVSGGANLFLDVLAVSYNALNYWDGNPANTSEERLYGYDEFTQMFSNWYESKVQQAKADSLARVLRLAGIPDVVALQELEWAQGRSDVFAPDSSLRKELESLGYRSFLLGKQGAGNKVAITTAFVSRYPLLELPAVPFSSADPAFAKFSERERSSVSHSTRDIQVAELRLGESRLRLFNTHWRSKGCSGEDSCDLSERVRVANGEVLARELSELRKSAPKVKALVMGDLNSSLDDAAVKKLGSSSEKTQIAQGKLPEALYNLWFEIPADNRWEHEFSGRRNTLSHIFVSDSLFKSSGFEYVDGSFFVLGQYGTAAEILMNPNGTPLRWQETKLRFEEAPAQKREAMRLEFASRGCFDKATKSKSRRKCRESYTEYVGVGYSDHLPIGARFSFSGDDDPVSLKVQKNPIGNLPEFSLPRCKMTEATSLDKIEFWKNEHLGRCVFWRPVTPQPLKVRGVYEFGFVVIKENAIGITMNGGYNPAAKNKVVVGGANDKSGKDAEMSPASDMCFARKVLQHEGGAVAMVLGRLGFDNGMPAVFVHNRDDIDLDDLPEEKSKACD